MNIGRWTVWALLVKNQKFESKNVLERRFLFVLLLFITFAAFYLYDNILVDCYLFSLSSHNSIQHRMQTIKRVKYMLRRAIIIKYCIALNWVHWRKFSSCSSRCHTHTAFIFIHSINFTLVHFISWTYWNLFVSCALVFLALCAIDEECMRGETTTRPADAATTWLLDIQITKVYNRFMEFFLYHDFGVLRHSISIHISYWMW